MSFSAVAKLAGLTAVLLFMLANQTASAQTYGQNLPPGVLEVTINGLPISGSQSPTVNTPTPTITGRLAPGTSNAQFSIMSQANNWTVPVNAATGAFQTSPPSPLQPGMHSLFINNALVGRFTVIAGATALPVVGTGLTADSRLDLMTAAMAVTVVLLLAGLLAGAIRFRREAR